ncbi:selenocysteine-specific translation elongation factor [Rhodoplanes elegans]|uniref:Selenocysteine-specific elongation factor n=1 Tax=Rhodoplanes elegans TaxID=29408 RepID=A0A327KTJ2_9BRAD|nr:selenocysteine-specific translation elongation factor [Rhodoplanes elegans]RAI41274.1 selenocysteine-specific translation elongation factor [Rhodoplanes elegans]
MIVGTAGHIDHGKTSLVRALTGVDTDRLKEEKARGISIDLGFAYVPTPDGGVLGFVDVPGHERFVHTMVAGASGIDLVLLVVAGDDGVMPQTREHLAIVDLLGIRTGIVALTKSDMVPPERRAEATAEIAAALAGTGLADAPIVPVSSVTGEGIEALRAQLFDAARAFGRREAGDKKFRLAVDRSFTLAGTGTVVTGTVLSGRVTVGDRVTVSPSGLSARVRSIHAQNRPAGEGVAGDRCALNLAGDQISKEAIRRGDMVLDPTLHAPADRIDVTLRLLPGEAKPPTQWMPVRLHHASAEVGARIVLLGDAPPAPGREGRVQLVLETPIAAAAGDRFVLRDVSASRTIGGGRFLDLRGPARKRRTPERVAQLDALALDDPGAALAALLARPPAHVELTGFARDHALADDALARLVETLGIVRIADKDLLIGLAAPTWEALTRDVVARLDAFHADNPDLPGVGLERLRLQIEPRLPAPAFRSVLQGLARAGAAVLDGAWVRRPGHAVRLSEAEELIWQRIAPTLGGAERFKPPRVRDLAGLFAIDEVLVRRVLRLTARTGRVDEVAHDHYFLRGTVAEMVTIARDLADQPSGVFTAAQFRDRLDNGRKVAIQILEFFDRHGVTLRRGDLRRMNKHRLDLFGSLPAGDAQAGEAAGAEPDATAADADQHGRESSPVGRPDFKSGRGREPVSGGFDSHSLPPSIRSAR